MLRATVFVVLVAALTACVPPNKGGKPTQLPERPAAGAAADLSDLVGVRASSGETAVRNRGYRLARSEGLTSFYYNPSIDACWRIVTANGRYAAIARVGSGQCRGGGNAGAGGDGLAGTPAEFEAMTGPCIRQAARLAGVGRGDVAVLERIRTGGGPILTLSARGAKYTCRRENDGRVTVFSEYAN